MELNLGTGTNLHLYSPSSENTPLGFLPAHSECILCTKLVKGTPSPYLTVRKGSMGFGTPSYNLYLPFVQKADDSTGLEIPTKKWTKFHVYLSAVDPLKNIFFNWSNY